MLSFFLVYHMHITYHGLGNTFKASSLISKFVDLTLFEISTLGNIIQSTYYILVFEKKNNNKKIIETIWTGKVYFLRT